MKRGIGTGANLLWNELNRRAISDQKAVAE